MQQAQTGHRGQPVHPGIVISRYGIPGDKVEVVYNGVERNGGWSLEPVSIRREEKIVLFLGRITMQKGPEYFLAAAKKVLEVMDNVKFVMAGSGDMIRRSIELAAQMGIGHKVLFTGFLRGDDVRRSSHGGPVRDALGLRAVRHRAAGGARATMCR
jgi:glycogen synthase